MKYKLLKEYPWVETGCIGELQIGYNRYKFIGVNHSVYIDRDVVENNPDWFEPVIERWTANNEQYYWFNSTLHIESYTDDRSPTDRFHHASGNYFRTKDQAIEASKRIKKCLMEYHAEIGE